MSLLEDVFLEDEAGEAQELERVIEGDEFEERPRSRSDSDENSVKDDEAEEDKTRVDPTSAKQKRVIKNPRFVLNPARLTGPRGIQVIPEHFKDFKFKGKGHEREDLDLVLKKLEHWAYRLYPKFEFEDCLKKIETLGKKRPVMVQLQKIRSDQFTSDEAIVQKDSSDEEAAPEAPEEDEFDKLLQQQIDKARATPMQPTNTPFSDRTSVMPKATSSPSINDEQRERILRNRRMAEERRLARKGATQQDSENQPKSPQDLDTHKKNKSNVIDSSDEEDNVVIKNATIEIHNSKNIIESDTEEIAPKEKEIIDSTEETNSNIGHDIVEIVDGKVSPKTSGRNNTDVLSSDDNNVTNGMASHDIVELDDLGHVVSKSPKNIRSKKYIKHQSKNDTIIENNDVVELDDLGYVMTKSPENTHKNKTNASSEKNIVLKTYSKITKTTKRVGIPNVIDSDDDALVINENDNIESPGTKRNRSVNDSSDDDLVMNESVTVEIHTNKIDVFDNSIATNGDIVMSKTPENINTDDTQTNIVEDKTDFNLGDVDIPISIENGDTELNSENVCKTNPANQDTIDSQNQLMDVDFSDDF